MRLYIKCLAHLVLVAALLLLTACGNDSPKMVITTQNGITTYNGIDRQICHVADGEQRELNISVSRQDGSISISVLQTEEKRLGILTICIPIGTQIIAEIVYDALSHIRNKVAPLELDNSGSVALGIMFIVFSLICRYGAECQKGEA